jgi:probable rRNA maturation factor
MKLQRKKEIKGRYQVQIKRLHSSRVPIRGIKDCVKKLLSLHGVKSAQISVVLANDDFLRTLNHEYRGVDAVTDSLSFPIKESKDEFLAELFVSLDRAKVSAAQFGHTLEDEVKVLLLHGLLHCLGYEHKGPITYMKRKDILKELPAHFYENKDISR